MTNRVTGKFLEDGVSEQILTTGGRIVLLGSGDIGTGEAGVQLKLPDGVWDDLPATVIDPINAAEISVSKFPVPGNFLIRVSLTGSVSPDFDYLLQA